MNKITVILITLMCLLVLPEVMAQDSLPIWAMKPVTYEPVHRITIYSPSGKELYLNYEGDTLTVSGNLQLDSAAVIFLRELVEMYSIRMNELKNKILELKGENKRRDKKK